MLDVRRVDGVGVSRTADARVSLMPADWRVGVEVGSGLGVVPDVCHERSLATETRLL